MTMSRVGVLCVLAAVVNAPAADADGYLWFGAEIVNEGRYYRYNLQTEMVDLTLQTPRPPGAMHWNNMATDGARLYIGSPTTDFLGVCDGYTGALATMLTYSTSLAGHKEDGAFRADTGNLLRVTFNGHLHETTTAGTFVNTWIHGAALVGLEWVDGQIYATDYNGGHIGRITITGPATAQWTVIAWAAGAAPAPPTAGLAYDAGSGVLYLAAGNRNLYRVTFNPNGTASATLARDLSMAGVPNGTLIDGMGWVALERGCKADFDADGFVTGLDFDAFVAAFEAGDISSDCDGDGFVTGLDFDAYVLAFEAGC